MKKKNKKRKMKKKNKKGKAILCSAALEYKMAGKAACEPTVECLVRGIWRLWVSRSDQKRGREYRTEGGGGECKVEDGHRDKTEHNDLLPAITSKVTPFLFYSFFLRADREHVLKTQG